MRVALLSENPSDSMGETTTAPGRDPNGQRSLAKKSAQAVEGAV
jgi:hypothetical protein